jgi:hypothetical protein
MHILRRTVLGSTALAASLALAVGTVAAGNFAEVSMIDAGAEPPAAGEPRELEFLLLQHGVTPVTFGEVTLVAVLPATGETFSVPLIGMGDGHWGAAVTFPVAGDWQVRVTHSVFETSEPSVLAVAGSGAAVPASAAGAPVPAFLALVAVAALVIVVLVVAGVRQAGRPMTGPARAG